MIYKNTKPYVVVHGGIVIPPLKEIDFSAIDLKHETIKQMIADGVFVEVKETKAE